MDGYQGTAGACLVCRLVIRGLGDEDDVLDHFEQDPRIVARSAPPPGMRIDDVAFDDYGRLIA